MQIAVISDLHLGRKDKLDQFNRNQGAEAQLYTLLRYLENHVDRIILLGDIFETLRSKTLDHESQLRSVLRHYPKVSKKILTNEKYVLLQGNHDLVTGDLLGAPEMLKIKDNGTSIAFFHGHQLDPIVADFWTKNFERFGVWMGGWLERMGLDITRKGNISSKFKALNNQWKVGKFEHAAAVMGSELGADIVVTGHSHHPMKVEFDEALFLNSGTRVCGRQDMILIDTTAHDYLVYKKFNPSSQTIPGVDCPVTS
tara:strand:+ start:97 stop:861 length:765 start_codon:yes stop_codon:yes gene_type:complete